MQNEIELLIKSLIDGQNALLLSNEKLTKELSLMNKYNEAFRVLGSSNVLNQVKDYVDLRQYSFLETVEKLHNNDYSFTRFGDGEIKLMLREDFNLRFQKNSPAVSHALKKIFEEPNKDMLFGFPHLFRNFHWSNVWADVWYEFKPYLKDFSRVGNSHVSRPVFFQYTGATGLNAWREVWNKKNITLVTGKGSRFELTPALFDCCGEIDTIHSTPTQAVADVPRVLDLCKKSKSDLFLISLGPAGSILADLLSRHGRRAIDIGHISDSYENIFNGGKWPEAKNTILL